MGEQCKGKVRYRSGAKARRAIQLIRQQGEQRDGDKKPRREYQCEECRGFHLTSGSDRW